MIFVLIWTVTDLGLWYRNLGARDIAYHRSVLALVSTIKGCELRHPSWIPCVTHTIAEYTTREARLALGARFPQRIKTLPAGSVLGSGKIATS